MLEGRQQLASPLSLQPTNMLVQASFLSQVESSHRSAAVCWANVCTIVNTTLAPIDYGTMPDYLLDR